MKVRKVCGLFLYQTLITTRDPSYVGMTSMWVWFWRCKTIYLEIDISLQRHQILMLSHYESAMAESLRIISNDEFGISKKY